MATTAAAQTAYSTGTGVVVRGARKSYVADEWVLDGMDLTAPEASIYALLGASGCGKTTLLTCIMGLRRLNAGSVSVMGWRPGDPGSGIPGPRVGFMPQELGLQEGFTIAETMKYFGRVAGLQDDAIEARSAELLKFLDIPTKTSCPLDQLSGGQKQRISLAVTLLHSPPLLILDEPTVGSDPVLRQNIWDFLVNLTRTAKTTVIITTHYIEEARQADKVGLMRRGKLLVEDRPEDIIARSGCANLEDVFLGLSVEQERIEESPVDAAHAQPKTTAAPETSPSPSPALVPLKKHSNVLACTWRAFTYYRRYKWVTAYALMMPVLCLVAYVYSVGRDPRGMHLALVNEDSPDRCARGWRGFADNCEDTLDLSCRFLSLMLQANEFVVDDFPSTTKAREAVQSGAAWGVVHFPANFSYHMVRRQLYLQDASDEDVEGSQVDAHLDMSNQYMGNMVRNALLQTSLRFHDDLQRGCGQNRRFGAVPINVMDPLYGSREPSFQDFALPGVLLCVMYFPAIFYSTANFLEDKLTGVMNRSASAGVTQLESLIGRAILDCTMNALSTALVVVCTFVLFQFTNQGSYLTLSALLYVQGLCGLWVGYFVAALSSSHFAATFFSMGIFLGTTFLSGMFWPMQGMHWLLKAVAPLTPMMPAVEGARTVLFQGSNKRLIALGFVIVGGWTLLFMLTTLGLLNLQRRIGEGNWKNFLLGEGRRLRSGLVAWGRCRGRKLMAPAPSGGRGQGGARSGVGTKITNAASATSQC